MDKINLNFFGEQVTIDTPKDLSLLRAKIAEKYSLSSSDVAEIILFYTKDTKKSYIINGSDFDKFKELKISTIFLDVNQNSKLYVDNVSKLKEETEEKKEEEKEEKIDIEKEKKELEKLKAKFDEITQKQKTKRTLYEEKRREIILLKLELEKMDEELSLESACDMDEFQDEKNEINKKMEEIKKKIEPPKKEEVILKLEPPKPKNRANWCRSHIIQKL